MELWFILLTLSFCVSAGSDKTSDTVGKGFTPNARPTRWTSRRFVITTTRMSKLKQARVEERYDVEKVKVMKIDFKRRNRVPFHSDDQEEVNAAEKKTDSVADSGGYFKNIFNRVKKGVRKIFGSAVETEEEEPEVVEQPDNRTIAATNRRLRIQRRGVYGKILARRIKQIVQNCSHKYPQLGKLENTSKSIDSSLFYSIYTPGLVKFYEIFSEYGYEIRFCCGTVRDILNGVVPLVQDMVINALPHNIVKILVKHKIRIMETKGAGGHIIKVLIDNTRIKVISLRKGALSSPTIPNFNAWKADASTRDFTFNAMFLGYDGSLYDYFNGSDDLQNKVVRFVGSPLERIQEDYVRIVRYFRFFSQISNDSNAHDPAIIDIVVANAAGLRMIHGKRVWKDFQKLFLGDLVEETFKKILDLDFGKYLGIGPAEELDMKSFEYLCYLGKTYSYRPVTYVGSLLRTPVQVLTFNARMSLPAPEYNLLEFVVSYKNKSLYGSEPQRSPEPPQACCNSL